MTLVKTFRTLISGEDDDLKTAYETFHKMVEREQGIVRNATLASVEQMRHNAGTMQADVREGLVITESIVLSTKSIMARTQMLHTNLENQEINSERDSVLAWLSSLDFTEKQRSIFAKHQKGTGEWLLSDNRFQRWFCGEQNCTLWCPGIPGAGKTILTSVVVNYLEENSPGKVAIAYVYCDYKDPKTQNASEILSSVIRQLSEQQDTLPPEVKTFRDKYLTKRRYPSDEDRLSLASTLSQLFTKTYILIDALDECPEASREMFYLWARKLATSVRLLITSRANLQLQDRFPDLNMIDIVAQPFDVQAYLESQIDTHDRMLMFTAKDSNLKKDIIEEVNEKAAGMFLLAHLQMVQLCNQSSIKRVRTSMKALPTGVFAFYDSAMQRIDDLPEDDRQLAIRALSYVFCARRPLTVDELRHALGIEVGDTELDETAFPEAAILFDISAGLISIDEERNMTRLVHYTLQEYFERHREKLLSHPNLDFARTCLSYLSFDVFQDGACTNEKVLEQRLKDYCFIDYASHHWGHHVLSNQLQIWKGMLSEFFKDKMKLSSSVQILYMPRHRIKNWHTRFPRKFNLIHVIAYWGLNEILPYILQEGGNIDSQDSHGATALHLAAQHGHSAVVQLLIDEGAHIDMQNLTGETALALTARRGHKLIGELLLKNGASVSIKDEEGWTALNWAVLGRHDEMANALMAQFEPGDQRLNEALIQAAEVGNGKTVQNLLNVGANVDWKDSAGSTAITWAISEGHEETVRILLDNGADINVKDEFGNPPLHWAISQKGIAELLISLGADVDRQNDDGQTVLLWSAQAGHVNVLRLLLKNGANPNLQDKYGFTALHTAALKGFEEIAYLLLQNGAAPNRTDTDGWTPLHAAALKQHEGVMQMLIGRVEDGCQIVKLVAVQREDQKQQAFMDEMAERKSLGSTVVTGVRAAVNTGHIGRVQALLQTGIDIDKEDIGGGTALTLAATFDRDDIASLLLENGADVNRCERNGRSALHYASEYGSIKLIKLLVENGANVNAKIFTWTALLIASVRGREPIMTYFIRTGADVNAEDYHGRRALHWAAKHGYPVTAHLLLKEGSDLNAADRWGRTPLIWAVEHRQSVMVNFLLHAGAEVGLGTQDGFTALHLAAYAGDRGVVTQLLDKGADINTTTPGHFTALSIAVHMKDKRLVRLLLKKGADIGEKAQWSLVANNVITARAPCKELKDGNQKNWRGTSDDSQGDLGTVEAKLLDGAGSDSDWESLFEDESDVENKSDEDYDNGELHGLASCLRKLLPKRVTISPKS
ncbi:hypothetical protein MMC25_001315 [Agyrium rufum]|nr:hypothetical protein [Agyrium rufum]